MGWKRVGNREQKIDKGDFWRLRWEKDGSGLIKYTDKILLAVGRRR